MLRPCAILVALLLLGSFAAAPGTARAEEHRDREFKECPECPRMVAIPAGKFTMGSPQTEQGRFDVEGPQHVVSVRAFALAREDVTVEEFLTFLRETRYLPAPCDPVLHLGWTTTGGGQVYPPGAATPSREPASCLSWNDAQAYVAWPNGKVRGLPSAAKAQGGPYRLPSEAEWEYAARAGTTTARWWGDAIGRGKANCNGCGSQWDDQLIAPVDSFGPNPFGLYDMLGNVWQWLEDCWNESYAGAPADGEAWLAGDCGKRVMRGGSWSNVPAFVRAAARSRGDVAGRDFDYSSYAGFRVARRLP
jgi:formylglycine-generating enzyme required for sulfatase activity